MKKFFKIIALMMVSASSVFAADAVKQEQVKVSKEEKIAKWDYRCEEVAGKTQTLGCGATQLFMVEDKETKKKSSIFIVDLMYDQKTKTPVFRFRTPLGTLLPQGITMLAGGKEVQKIPYTMCLPSALGCAATIASKEAIDTAMRNNKTVRFGFVVGNEPVAVDLETEGYAKILEKIKS